MTKEKLKATKRVFALALSLALTVPYTVPATALAATNDDIENAYAEQGYHLVWNDEFDGDTLNTNDWNVELHEPGWVNAELQRYTKLSEGNIEVKDGKLSIYPKAEKKEDAGDQGSSSGELLDSNDFDATWNFSINEGGAGSCEISDGKAVVSITDPGTVNYGVQLQKSGLPITKGHTYTVSFKAKASTARSCEVSLLDPDNGYTWYGGSSFNIGTTEDTYTITVDASDKASSDTVAVQINFGTVSGFADTSVAADVTLSDVSIIDETAAAEVHYKDVLGTDSFDDSWSFGTNAGGAATVVYDEGAAILNITDTGEVNYGVQLQKNEISLTAGHEYQLQFTAMANTAKACEVSLLDPDNGYAWYGGSSFNIGMEEEVKTIAISVGTDKADSDTIALQINFGKVSGFDETSVPAIVTLSDISLVDLSETTTDVDVKKAYNYTSGRVNTQGKQDFVYGYFEARARVPKGQGYLPAFWLMASDEDNYGQWPKCGEVDIMEVKGQDTATSYHTIHYGYNASSGHREDQHTVELSANEDDFYEEYHTFGLEWLPGELNWYVDGEKIGTSNEWFTGKDETSKLTYPAPFDQEFYVILNLAVGGSWVGYPDQAVVDDMENQSYDIDYVRVYQLDDEVYEAMEALVKEPEKTSTRRNPDASGNYVVNGNFANDLVESSSEKDGWELHLESENKTSVATIKNNEIAIAQAVEGTVDYSCQLKQANIPMVRGYEYELTFDAYADEARNVIVCVEGDSDNNWARYFGDETVALTTEKTSYSYKFTMTEKTDDTCCLEFALGNQGSTAPVHISNVKLVQTGGEEIIEKFEKSVAPDGNYILNGTFDQGEGRLGYWEVAKDNSSSVSVTNELLADGERVRELRVKIEIPEGTSEANPVIVSQTALAPIAKGTYEFSFDAYVEKGFGLGFSATIAGKTFSPMLYSVKDNYSFKVNNKKNLSRDESYVIFEFTQPGTYYLDNVVFHESAMIKNGSFNSGLAGYEYGAYAPGDATFGVDSQKAGNDTAFDADIKDTGDADWNIQLKQRGITLEKGKYYKLTYQAKATVDRKISVVFQRDGAKDDLWTVYSGDNFNDLTSSWQNFELQFQMNDDTDDDVLLSISMGAFDGNRITDVHHVYLDNFVLVETDENGNPVEAEEEDDPVIPDPEPVIPEPEPVIPEPEPVIPDPDPEPIVIPTSEWAEVDGEWYYFDADGNVITDAFRNGYYLTEDGTWDGNDKAAGWTKDDKGWWYDLNDGNYLANTWMMIDGKWYYFKANGYAAKNEYISGYWLGNNCAWNYPYRAAWSQDDGGWYYSDETLWIAQSEWLRIDEKWFYFDETSYMVTGTKEIDGKTYKFNKNGVCLGTN